MHHTKYQGSRPCGFRREDFFVFPNEKYVTPGAGHFWPQAHKQQCDPRGGPFLAPGA